MKVVEFRDACEALSRFATTRETASGPESRIGVQAYGGVVKLVAGTSDAGIIVELMPHEGNFSYTVDARPLLQASKALPTKDSIDIIVETDRFEVRSSSGGKVVLRPTGKMADSGFPAKPKKRVSHVDVDGADWERLSKVLPAVMVNASIDAKVRNRSYVCTRVNDFMLHIITVEGSIQSKYARFSKPTNMPDLSVSTGLTFWTALRALGKDGQLVVSEDGLMAVSGNKTAYASAKHVQQWDGVNVVGIEDVAPIPILTYVGGLTSFTSQRKQLIDVLKGQAPHDEHNRVTLNIDTGVATVTPYGSEDGQTMPVATVGRGVRSLRANLLLDILSAMDSKEVTVGWGSAPAVSISAKEYESWEILMAPVAIR